MTEYFDISDLEDELSRLIEVLQAPPALPPGRARKPGKGCGASGSAIRGAPCRDKDG